MWSAKMGLFLSAVPSSLFIFPFPLDLGSLPLLFKHKYLLSLCTVPGSVLGAGETDGKRDGWNQRSLPELGPQ